MKPGPSRAMLGRVSDPVPDLIAYLDRSPTPYHAVAESARRLVAAGFGRLAEADVWSFSPGDRCFVQRGGSLVHHNGIAGRKR